MMGAYRAFRSPRSTIRAISRPRDEYAMHGIQIWRSGHRAALRLKRFTAPAVTCLCYQALCEWHFGEIASCRSDHGGSHLVSEGAK